VEHLQALLEQAGYATFRDARHPLGLSQRQSAGKFTRDEASALIEQLEQAESSDGTNAPSVKDAPVKAVPAVKRPARTTAGPRAKDRAAMLRDLPDDVLADELVRRGWAVIAP
jgi:hypothetical protein